MTTTHKKAFWNESLRAPKTTLYPRSSSSRGRKQRRGVRRRRRQKTSSRSSSCRETDQLVAHPHSIPEPKSDDVTERSSLLGVSKP